MTWRRPPIGKLLRAHGHDSGVAAVEMALILPFLMLILMGMIDYGFYFYLNSTVVNAAREGARAGVVCKTGELSVSAADKAAGDYLAAGGITRGDGTNQARVDPVFDSPNLSVTVTIDPFVPLTGFLPTGTVPAIVTYTSTMRWELAP